MNSIGLRFLLGNGFVDVVLPIPVANAIIENWEKRHYHLKDIKIISGACLTGNTFAIDRDAIVAIHTATLKMEQNQLPAQTKGFSGGRN